MNELSHKGSILVVDDDLSASQELEAILTREGYEVRCAPDGQSALLFAHKDPPDQILLNIRLPDLDGLEACRRLKTDQRTANIPVIILSDIEDLEAKSKGFEEGAVDYIVKPYRTEEVLTRVQTHLALCRLQTHLDQIVQERTRELASAKEDLERETERRRQVEEGLREQLGFDALVAEISAHFISLPCDQINTGIQSAQRRICESSGIDRSAIWEASETTSGAIELTHMYQHPDAPAVPERPRTPISEIPAAESSPVFNRMHAEKSFPWIVGRVQNNQTVVIPRVQDLPEEAAEDRELLKRYGTKSTVVVPLWTGKELLGVMSFAAVQAERSWPEELIKRFQLVAQVFANAIARRRFETALRRSEERLTMAAASAAARLWELEVNTELIWTTQLGREFYGLAPGEDLTLEHLLGLVHPEDREGLHAVFRNAKDPGIEISADYRVVRPDGKIRWVSSRGRLKCNSSGQPESILGVSIDITDRKRMENQLKERLREIEELKQRLEKENVYLQEEVSQLFSHEEIIGQSDSLRRVLAQAEQVAPTDSTVLITGETGTGKELIARTIHSLSKRKDRVIVKVDCASLPATLIESELFGREKGAYTGAMTKEIGRFEMADGSSLFLDEIGELSPQLQAKLLRMLQSGEFERLGSPKTIRVDVRVIAATNRNLAEEVKKGTFREDLYYRLNVFPIEMPSLRKRQEDIPLLVRAFVMEFNKKMGKKIQSIPRKTMEALKHYGWPGNIRELRNIIERAVIISDGEKLSLEMPKNMAETPSPIQSLEEAEYQHILAALEKTGWRIKGHNGAAGILKLKPSTLYSKMERLGIPSRRKKDGIST